MIDRTTPDAARLQDCVYNWKFNTALRYLEGQPQPVQDAVKSLSGLFHNSGCFAGHMGWLVETVVEVLIGPEDVGDSEPASFDAGDYSYADGESVTWLPLGGTDDAPPTELTGCEEMSPAVVKSALLSKDVRSMAHCTPADFWRAIELLDLAELTDLCVLWDISPDAARLVDSPGTPIQRARLSLNEGIKRALGSATRVVHVLHEGTPLCQFMPGLPESWPPGHAWVAVESASIANCGRCVRRAADIDQPLSISFQSFGPGETPEIRATVVSDAHPMEVVEALREDGIPATHSARDPLASVTVEGHQDGCKCDACEALRIDWQVENQPPNSVIGHPDPRKPE